jgi:hypothetical protein
MNQDISMGEIEDAATASPTPRAHSRIDTVEAWWDFLQHNFLLLFPISLFTLLGIFAAVIVASP